jgi:N-acetylneuraminate synthase
MNKKIMIIAEAGVNHNGSLKLAKELIDVAAEAGADVVKFQTFKAEASLSKFAAKAEYQIKNTGVSESQLEMVKKLELDEKSHIEMYEHCQKRSIQFMSTPFDFMSVDFLVNELKVSQLKIASGEISNAPLLLKMAYSGLPIILSTGMSTLGDVETALGILAFGYLNNKSRPSISEFKKSFFSNEGQALIKEKITLLHCTTEYPAPFEDINLRAMMTLSQAFGTQVGFSDHSRGIAIPIAAAGMGATVIEKHFTLDKNLPGPDHVASMDPAELKQMVKSVREVELALGNGIKIPSPSEIKNIDIARKSIVANVAINQGETFSVDNLAVKRPGTGISPLEYWDVLGKPAKKNYYPDEQINGDEK